MSHIVLRQPAGVTVAYVKLLVEQQTGIPVAQQTLQLNGAQKHTIISLSCMHPLAFPLKAYCVHWALGSKHLASKQASKHKRCATTAAACRAHHVDATKHVQPRLCT